MSRAIKLENNDYLDSTGIVHNRELLSEKIIEESGTNTYGDYVKFADGTLICRHSFTITSATTTVNNVAWSGMKSGLTYPCPFNSIPSTHYSCNKGGAWTGKNNEGTKTTSPEYCIFTAGTWTSTTWQIDYIAIGKWK